MRYRPEGQQLPRVLIVGVALAAPVAAQRAEACTCMVSPTSCSTLLTAAAVFEGGNYNTVTFTGVRNWRGEATTTVVTDAPSSACGRHIPNLRMVETGGSANRVMPWLGIDTDGGRATT